MLGRGGFGSAAAAKRKADPAAAYRQTLEAYCMALLSVLLSEEKVRRLLAEAVTAPRFHFGDVAGEETWDVGVHASDVGYSILVEFALVSARSSCVASSRSCHQGGWWPTHFMCIHRECLMIAPSVDLLGRKRCPFAWRRRMHLTAEIVGWARRQLPQGRAEPLTTDTCDAAARALTTLLSRSKMYRSAFVLSGCVPHFKRLVAADGLEVRRSRPVSNTTICRPGWR